MRPIPPAMRERIAADPFMKFCIHRFLGKSDECRNQFGGPVVPEWEHAHEYAGRQINEPWAIVPCCWYHHRGGGLNKRFNQYVAISRATIEDLAKYPKTNWVQLRVFLYGIFGDISQIIK